MILLDTHVWIWWVQGDPNLSAALRDRLQADEKDGLAVSVISCLEVARLTAHGRLILPLAIDRWITAALAYPHIRLVELSPKIAIESTRLPGSFHKDPSDRIIVATAREFDVSLATADRLILDYPHVRTL